MIVDIAQCAVCGQMIEVTDAAGGDPGWGNFIQHSKQFIRVICEGSHNAVKLEKEQSRLI